ncbi:MAG: REDY-like protein HapK [Alphaproteobacteria bacterium]
MRIIVLFNLRPGVDPAVYEAWAASADAPTVRALPSVAGFRVHALTGLLMGEGAVPFQYVEVLDVADMDQLGRDIGSSAMQTISAQFQKFADNPVFLTTREVGA